MTRHRPRPLRTALVLTGVLGSIVLLHAAATLGLRGPTGLSATEVDEWFADPVAVAATIARWLALAMSYYLFVVVAAVGIVGMPADGSGRLRVGLPGGATGLLGVALGLGAVVVPLAAHMADTGPVDDPGDAPLVLQAVDEQILRLTPVPETDDAPDRASTRRSLAEVPAELGAAGLDQDPDAIWIVTPGDHLWSIAEESLAEAWGRADLSEAEIAAYWRTLIAANEDRLVEPGNPDLILPGQRILLPDAPVDPAAGRGSTTRSGEG